MSSPSAEKQQKQDMREQARLHRDRMDVDQTDFEKIVDVFFEELAPPKEVIVALYWPMGSEFDCRALMDELVGQGYRCVLPVSDKDNRIMTFVEWTRDTKMKRGSFGIFEPESGETLTPDLVFAPLLAFDQKGYRLGQGGGYYDATLEALRAKKDVTYIGIGYAAQAVLLKLPREAHDIPLDSMLTPQGLIEF